MPAPPPQVQLQLKQAFDLLNAGRDGDARAIGEKIVKSIPREPNALYLLGVLDHKAGDLKSAARYFEKSHKADKRNPAALGGMGILRLDEERYGEAAKIFEDLRRTLPRDPAVMNNLGLAYKGQRRFDRAIQAFDAALKLHPGYAEAYANLGAVLTAVGDNDQATRVLEEGLRRCPRDSAIALNLGECYSQLGKVSDALSVLRLAVQQDPRSAEAKRRLANLLIIKGQFDEAWAIFKAISAEYPDDAMILFDIADLAEARPEGADHSVAEYRQMGLDAFRSSGKTTPPPILAHRLAQALEAEKDYDEAFRYYKLAQDSFREAQRSVGNVYQRRHIEAIYDELIAYFGHTPPTTAPLEGPRASDRPIFILGMPRSGTTLLEQVLSSHPAIFGAGELMTLPQLIEERQPNNPSLPTLIETLGTAGLDDMAQAYLDDLATRDADSRFVTDKLPANFVNTGLIKTLFPKALILNTERHPLDICWSIFVQKFGSNLVYDHDLGDIGHYYREYDRLMAFWRGWDSTILPVRYEDMVADLEATILPILDRLGLNWEPPMAKFFESDRDVQTASRLQVRRPIYKTSVQRWRHFEPKLGPLLAELGDLPAEFDRPL